MSDTDLQYQLMMEGRMNLMHLPPGAIAWLWDRPTAQIDAAEALATAASAYGNPVADASLLRADQNILIIKCEGGECFRVYPDGGYSFNDTPMDMGGCASVLQGGGCGCEYDENGHMADPSPGDGYNDAMDMAEPMERIGNDEHMNDIDPHAEVVRPVGLTNIAGEPTREGAGENDGPGTSDGMGTGSPTQGWMMMSDDELDKLMSESTRINRDFDESELDELAEIVGAVGFAEDKDPCWKDYEMVGRKKKNGKSVPNCVPKKS